VLIIPCADNLKGRHFSSDAEVIAAAETWLDGQLSELFLNGLRKLEVLIIPCADNSLARPD